MANIENLIPQAHKLTVEEASRGGIRSGEARREKATFKKTLEMLLDQPSSNGKTYREMIILGQIKGAIKGNSQNYKMLLDTIGELLQPEESKARVTIVNSLPKDDEDGPDN